MPQTLVVLPYAGAGIGPFAGLRKSARPDFEVKAVELPGREARITEPPLRTWAQVREFLGTEVLPSLAGDYIVYGHSMGALLGYELSRLGESAGHPPKAVCLAAYPGPAADKPYIIGAMNDERLRDYMRSMTGVDSAALMPAELLELVLGTVRADLALCDSYPGADAETISSPMLALYGESDPEVGRPEVSRWATRTTGPFQIAAVAGDHLFFREQADTMIGLIRDFLADCHPAS